jgi:hypothetical protein
VAPIIAGGVPEQTSTTKCYMVHLRCISNLKLTNQYF